MTMDENVAKAVESTDDEFEVMLEGLSPLNRAEYMERTTFPMDRNHWQTIRARLVELEAENERLKAHADAHRDGRLRALERLASAEALLREQESVIASQRAMIWYLARCRGDQAIPLSVIATYNPVNASIQFGIKPNGDHYITAHLSEASHG